MSKILTNRRSGISQHAKKKSKIPSSSHLHHCSSSYTPPQSKNGSSIVKESEAVDQVPKTNELKSYNVERTKKRQKKTLTKLKGENLEAGKGASVIEGNTTKIKKEDRAKVKLLKKQNANIEHGAETKVTLWLTRRLQYPWRD